MAVAEAFAELSVLGNLNDRQRARLVAQGREVTVAPGRWLMRQGQEADTMYLIRSGRLEVVHEGPPETVIRTMRRGDVVGELALLHPGCRTASVRARRETVLLELSRRQFEALIEDEPSFALALARAVGAQLAVSHAPLSTAPTPRTIAVVRLDAAAPGPHAVREFADGLAAAGGLITLEPRRGYTQADLLTAIDRAEQDGERVLLLTGEGAETQAWNELCLREAEVVLALTSGVPDRRWLGRDARLHGCELLAAGAMVSEEAVSALQPRELQVVSDPGRLSASLQATARRLSGRAVGVVLSGGGVRAAAHMGVLEELLAAGLQIDRIGGVSSGAAIAAGIAAGWKIDDLYQMLHESLVSRKAAADYAVPAYALLRGQRARQVLQALAGSVRVEELPIRYFSVSCDLVSREPVVHRRGLLVDAVYASLAIPGILPPVATEDGRLLVDGGVLDNLPVETMAGTGEGPVIASDVTSQPAALRSRERRPRTARSWLRRGLTGSAATLPKLSETILRTVTVGSADTIAAVRRHADLVIAPEVAGVGMMDWKRFDEMRELGRLAARRVLEQTGGFPWS
jgi:NTE family protein